jgi:hypothetical protein
VKPQGRESEEKAGREADFVRDLSMLLERLEARWGLGVRRQLERIKDKLVELHARGVVKINHTVMEVLCAAHMVHLGYEVDVERYLGDGLVCDVYGLKGGGAHIIEVETGFSPPEAALDPQRYLRARVVSKTARYSRYADKFSLATPRYNILEIPPALLKPPRLRTGDEVKALKQLCDLYYSRPPIKEEELWNCRIHSVIILNIDDLELLEVSAEEYYENALRHIAPWK